MIVQMIAKVQGDPINYVSKPFETVDLRAAANAINYRLSKETTFTFETEIQGIIVFGVEDTKKLRIQLVEYK